MSNFKIRSRDHVHTHI